MWWSIWVKGQRGAWNGSEAMIVNSSCLQWKTHLTSVNSLLPFTLSPDDTWNDKNRTKRRAGWFKSVALWRSGEQHMRPTNIGSKRAPNNTNLKSIQFLYSGCFLILWQRFGPVTTWEGRSVWFNVLTRDFTFHTLTQWCLKRVSSSQPASALLWGLVRCTCADAMVCFFFSSAVLMPWTHVRRKCPEMYRAQTTRPIPDGGVCHLRSSCL